MAIITRDAKFGWNVKLHGLPAIWFAERAAAVACVASQWAYVANP